MHLVLVYRPEAADGHGRHLEHATDPFDGVEVLTVFTTDVTDEMVLQYTERRNKEHPDWKFLIMGV